MRLHRYSNRGRIDICEYPDSGKLNILPEQEVFETKDKVDYFQGEESIRQRWPKGQGSDQGVIEMYKATMAKRSIIVAALLISLSRPALAVTFWDAVATQSAAVVQTFIEAGAD